MTSQAFFVLADAFNLLQHYHLASSTVMHQLQLIETLRSFINTINDTRNENEKIGVNADTYLIFELIHDILIIINRDKKYYDDYKRTNELCQKLFGDKTESEIVEFLNNHVVQMRALIDEALR